MEQSADSFRAYVQVAELDVQDGKLICDRNKDFDFELPKLG